MLLCDPGYIPRNCSGRREEAMAAANTILVDLHINFYITECNKNHLFWPAVSISFCLSICLTFRARQSTLVTSYLLAWE